MKGFLKSLNPFGQHKACIINESTAEVKRVMKLVKKYHFLTEGFTDYRKLLFNLHASHNYSLIIIHENGNKSKPNMLTVFIHQLHPDLPVIVYKTQDQLEQQLQSFA